MIRVIFETAGMCFTIVLFIHVWNLKGLTTDPTIINTYNGALALFAVIGCIQVVWMFKALRKFTIPKEDEQ